MSRQRSERSPNMSNMNSTSFTREGVSTKSPLAPNTPPPSAEDAHAFGKVRPPDIEREASRESLRTAEAELKKLSKRKYVRAPLPKKTAIAAAILFIAGLCFLIAGFAVYFGRMQAGRADKGLTLLILGGISMYSRMIVSVLS